MIIKEIKAQKVVNKKGYVSGGTIKVQDICLEPGVKYKVTINQIEKIENEQFSDSFYGNGNGGWD